MNRSSQQPVARIQGKEGKENIECRMMNVECRSERKGKERIENLEN